MELTQTPTDINEYGRKYHFYHNADNNTIICTRTYKGQMIRGIAKCDPDDNFNLKDGKRLAYLRCKYKFTMKKYKHAQNVCRDALVVVAQAKHNLCKAYEFVDDTIIQLDNITTELEKFEAELNVGQ